MHLVLVSFSLLVELYGRVQEGDITCKGLRVLFVNHLALLHKNWIKLIKIVFAKGLWLEHDLHEFQLEL